MNDDSLSAVESLYFRWKAFRTAGRPVGPAALCRDCPELRPALEERIAAENPTDEPDSTGAFTPRPVAPAFEVVEDPGAGAYQPDDGTGDFTPEPSSGADEPAPGAEPPRAESAPGSRYEVLGEHARGGMGRVSVAVDTELNRRVAFKDIQERFADDPVTRHRFTREALITGQLEHPGVIPVYGLGADAAGRPFYAMRFVEGQSLKDALKGFHADPPRRAPVGAKGVAFRGLLKRFADVCNAVAFAHSKQVVHRDLKPANIMLGPFGETLVVDWGLARSFADTRPDARSQSASADGSAETAELGPEQSRDTIGTRTGVVMGTPAYMSPEQAAGDLPTLGPAWDVYSLGATLYEVLAGRAPFAGKPAAVLRDIADGRFAPPRAVAGWVPKPLDAIARKAMSLRPEDRYATALDLAADVERYLADEPVTAYRETRTERVRRWAKRHPALVRTVAVLFLLGTPALALGFGVVYYQKDRAQEAERLKDGALKREEAAHATERAALKRTEDALEGQTRSLEQVRDTLDLTTDELVGKVLAKQSKIGAEEREFLEKLIASYLRFAAAGDGSPEKQLLAARARLRIAHLRYRLGDTAAALGGYREAVAALRPLAAGAAPGSPVRRELPTALLGCSRTAPASDAKRSVDELKEALVLREEALKADPNNPDRLRELGAAELAAADLLSELGALDRAAPVYRQYIRDLQGPTVKGVLGPGAYEQLGDVYDHLARLEERQGKFDEAYRELDGAVGLFGALERTFPKEPRFRYLWTKARTAQVALLHRAGKTEEAEQVIAPLMAALRDLVREYPAVREYRQGQAAALAVQVIVLLARGRPADAAKSLDEARGALTRLAGDYPEFPGYRTELIAVLREQARVNLGLGRHDAATRAKEEADALEGKAKNE